MLIQNDGFLPRRPVEDLILDENVVVSGKIVQYLFTHQLNGIRFLYKNYKQKCCCILNDESELGKCVQTIAFLSSIIKPKTDNVILVVCLNPSKIIEWKYHFSKITNLNVIENDEINSGEIYLIDLFKFNQSIDLITSIKWKYIIVDERLSKHVDVADLLQVINSLECINKLFIISDDITKNLHYFYNILKIFNIKHLHRRFNDFLSDFNTNNKIKNRENIFNYCRDFRLRRYKHQIGNLSLIDLHRFENNLIPEIITTTMNTNIVLQQNTDDYFNFDSSFEIDLNSNIDSTMSPLIYKSDTEESIHNTLNIETDIVVNEIIEKNNDNNNNSVVSQTKEIPVADNNFSENSYLDSSYFQCGQRILSQDLFATPITSSTHTEKDFITPSLSLKDNIMSIESSNEIEIVKDDIVTIVVRSSSESINMTNNRTENIVNERYNILACVSPDLFADSQSDIIEPHNNNGLFLNTSTPIDCDYPENVLQISIVTNNNKLFNVTNNETLNHFEITKNSDFHNIICVNDDYEMSPLRVSTSDSEDSYISNEANLKKMQIVNQILKTPTSVKKSKYKNTEKTPDNQISGSSKRKKTPDSSSKWLSAKKICTETTPRSIKRRRNLENWFRNSL